MFLGKKLGAHLNAGGDSIPNYRETGGEAEDQGLWELIDRDVHFELRILAGAGDEDGTSFGSHGAGIYQRLQNLKVIDNARNQEERKSRLLKNLKEAGLDGYWTDAFDELNENIVQAALETAGSKYSKEHIDAVSRAVVWNAAVTVFEKTTNCPVIFFDSDCRDETVDSLIDCLTEGNIEKSVTEGVRKIFGLIMGLGASKTLLQPTDRGALGDASCPAIGDVLIYQARGQEIRNEIKRVISKCDNEVVLLAHSLGGIACAELLIDEDIPEVKKLITVGSQMPFFYEINALGSLPFVPRAEGEPVETRLPKHFQPWHNFYHERDFLSFIGNKLFGARVSDTEVRNRSGFPWSHGSYWYTESFWDEVVKIL